MAAIVAHAVGVPKILVTKKEAAEALSVCVRTIDNLIYSKQLSFRRVGRSVRIPYSALVSFARRDHVTAPPESGARTR